MSNKSFVILASGRFERTQTINISQNRQRFLEIIKGKPCISHVIDVCSGFNIPIFVVINHKNIKLETFLKENHPTVHISKATGYTMRSTYEVALNVDNNDKIISAADIWNVKKENMEKYINSPYKSALYKVSRPWGPDIRSSTGNMIRRGDIGDSVVLISQEHIDTYYCEESISKAKEFHKLFYPNERWDDEKANHLWTWLDYVFFNEISSCSTHTTNNIENEKGAIEITDLIYLDND